MNPAAPQNAKLSQTDNSQQIVDNTYLPADQSLDGVEGNLDPTQTNQNNQNNQNNQTNQTTRIRKEQQTQQELQEPQQQIQVEQKVYKQDLQDNGEQIVDEN